MRRIARTLAPAFVLALSLGACGYTNGHEHGDHDGHTHAEAGAAINASCPIMPDHAVSADGGTVEYKGDTIGFCCEGCIDGWNEMSDDEKAAYVASVKK